LLEAGQAREELAVDEVAQVVAGHGGVVVELAVGVLGRSPCFPAIGLGQDEPVGLALQLCLGGLVVLQGVEVLQEQQPGRLLGVVELAAAAGVLVQDVVDVLEGLLEHGEADSQANY
jgi:hypothetical protein